MSEYSKIGVREVVWSPAYMGKITGEAKYSADIKLPHMLTGKIFRSSLSHARILNINTEKASALRGVKTVVTAKDAPTLRYGGLIKDQTLFATDKVLYMGAPVAAVAAVDELTALEALSLIEVDYEELPAVFDGSSAMQPGAPILHEDLMNYAALWPAIRWGNVCSHTIIHKGNIETGFKESDEIFEDNFRTPKIYQHYMEPHATVAYFDSGGKLTIWTTTAAPYLSRMTVSEALRIPMSKVRVIATNIGGSFGGKAEVITATPASLLAYKSGRPIRLVHDTKEEFIDGRARHPSVINIKTGVKKDGTLVARKINFIYDTGAYATNGPGMVCFASNMAAGPYRIPYVRVDGFCVYTNNPISDAARGYGNLQVHYGSEVQMDIIAEALGIDPLDLRLQNGIEEGDSLPSGQRVHNVGYKEALRKAADAADWYEKRRKKEKNRGIGIASMQANAGFLGASAVVKVNEDGTITALAGSTDLGQGSNTVLAQIVAEEMGVPLETIDLVTADTEITPYDAASVASRVTWTMGTAVKMAAADAKRQLLQLASNMLKEDIENLVIENAEIFVKNGPPGKLVPFWEASIATHFFGGGPIIGKYSFYPIAAPLDPKAVEGYPYPPLPIFPYACQIAEVEVDPELGRVKVIKITAAHDCGKAINPINVEGQIEGGISLGVGHALYEEVIIDKGKVLNPSFTDYRIPSSLDMPQIQDIIIENPDPTGPFGAKGVGEPAPVPTPPAIANAIYNAVGVRINEIPITPDKILKALKEKKGKS